MRSVMKHDFSRVPKASIPRSRFDRSHGHKTSFDAGYLVPFFVDEALPGDTFNAKLTAFARLATPIYPVMDNMKMSFFFFAVPNRLLWENWEKFCGAQDNPADSIDYTIPKYWSNTTINMTTADGPRALCDYMGLPHVASLDGTMVSALPFRAYNLIYNEWFRDQNLQDSVTVNTDDGPDGGTGDYDLLRRGKRHDYFTSCLPWPQKGDSVDLPLGTQADVLTASADQISGAQNQLLFNTTAGANAAGDLQTNSSGGALVTGGAGTGTSVYPSNLYADLSNATAATINQLRQAFQIQKLLERDARGGTRYVELIKAHFGVTSPDFRLQRPEYLGGGSIPINISAVAKTSQEAAADSTDPQGTLAAFGTAGGSVGFTKSFTEHCTLIGLVCVDADLTYQQGLERMWSRETRYDYYWPALAMIGEQSVLNKELWFTSGDTGTINDAVFGYQARYDEYRYKPSRISGLFRSDNAASLDAWHLSEDFSSLPSLDTTFIQSSPPIDRVIAVNTEPHFIFDSHMNLNCARPMPMFGVPGLIDHF